MGITNVFSSFNSIVFSFPLLFILVLYILFLVPYTTNENSALFSFTTTNGVHSALTPGLLSSMGLNHILVVLFIIMAAINIISLVAYIFNPLSHIILTFSLGFSIWCIAIILTTTNFIHNNIVHYTPLSTPSWLLSIMVLTEIVSDLIRPVTLSVRLAANLTAGHLLLGILSGITMFLSVFLQLAILLLEILVAFIQPFVFCMLVYLYANEVYDN